MVEAEHEHLRFYKLQIMKVDNILSVMNKITETKLEI